MTSPDPQPPAVPEHYREGWRDGYDQARIDRERGTDAAALAETTTPTAERADLLERLDQVIDLSRRLDADDLDPSVEPITDPERDVWSAAALLRSALHRYGIAVRDEYWALLASTPTGTEEPTP